MFFRTRHSHIELLTIYVDDILVTSGCGVKASEAQLDELSHTYDMKKLRAATYMLGMGVRQEAGTLIMEQKAYTEDILEETSYTNAKPRSTP